jgi:hypothetical protein
VVEDDRLRRIFEGERLREREGEGERRIVSRKELYNLHSFRNVVKGD